ncbi:MAG: discoidin domain-containing protein, partial [Acidimicrobiales bacterium]
GQTVAIGPRTFSRLRIEVLADTAGRHARSGGLTSTGFAEVRLGHLRLDEAIRPPVDLLRRAGPASADHALAVVLTRLRSAPTDVERLDEEPALVRVIDLPTPRGFALSGTARLSPRAPDAVVDRQLDPSAGTIATSSSRMAGPAARASAALDGDRATAWTAAFGEQAGQWIEVTGPSPRVVDHLDLTLLADGRHSVPTQLGIEVDGQRMTSAAVPTIADGALPGTTRTASIALPGPVSASRLRVTIEAVRGIDTPDWRTHKLRMLPVAVAELGAAGFERPAPRGAFATGCRTDLVTLDGHPLPVQVTGTAADAVTGAPLPLTSCTGAPVDLTSGDHELRAARGSDTGVDIDRLVLRSGAGGAPTVDPTSTLRAAARASASSPPPTTTVVHQSADAVDLRVSGARPDSPFWLAFGQSWNTGWHATIDGKDLGAPTLVDGFANGWQISPRRASFEVSLRFTPQHRVDLALWGSLAAALVCIGLTVRRPAGSKRTRRPAASDWEAGGPDSLTLASVDTAGPPLSYPAAAAVAVALAGLGAALVSPVVALLVGLLTLVVARGALPRRVTALAAPAAMGASASYVVLTVLRHHIAPGLDWPAELHRAHPIAWFALLAIVVDAIVIALRGARRR